MWRRILSEAVETLSEGQKTCLRLVARGMTSKEIAQATGLSPQTVDTYIKAAMSRLNATSRREAARLLGQHEVSQELGSPSALVVPAPVDGNTRGAAEIRGRMGMLIPPPLGGTVNELDATQRTFAVLKVAALSAAIVFALTLLIAGMLQTFR